MHTTAQPEPQTPAHSDIAADWDPEADRCKGARGGGLRGPARIEEEDRLRTECPVAYSSRYGGFYSLLRYGDVTAAALDYRRFPSGSPFVSMPDFNGLVPGSLNPPDHAPYRKLLGRFFSSKRIAELEPTVRGHCDELLDAMLAEGVVDAVSAFCAVLPARALCALMNLPNETYRDLLTATATFEEADWDPDRMNQIIFSIFSKQISQVIAARREQPLDPDADLLSGAMAMRVDGEPLTDETILGLGISMVGAGHATVADGLSTTLYRLAVEPALQAKLRRHPELIAKAVEEFLRMDPPLVDGGRHASEDILIDGRTIPAGCPVSLHWASGNRDPEAFPDPEAFIVERSPNRHLAFGHGIHKCAGAPMARMEMRVAIERLLSRTRGIELDGRPRLADSVMLNGFAHLPLRLVGA